MSNTRDAAKKPRKKQANPQGNRGEGMKKSRSKRPRESMASDPVPKNKKAQTKKSTGAKPKRKGQVGKKNTPQEWVEPVKKGSKRPAGPPPKPKWYNKLADIFVTVMTIVMVALAVLFFLSRNESKSLFGFRVFTVLTNSMAKNATDPYKDGFSAGDVILVQNIDPQSAKKGDIITYHPSIKSKAYLTHRVVKKLDDLDGDKGPYYVTKGDNNGSEDIPVHYTQVVAKVRFSIPKVGSVIKFISKHYIVSTIFIFSIYGFFWVMRNYFFPEVKLPAPRKKRKKARA